MSSDEGKSAIKEKSGNFIFWKTLDKNQEFWLKIPECIRK